MQVQWHADSDECCRLIGKIVPLPFRPTISPIPPATPNFARAAKLENRSSSYPLTHLGSPQELDLSLKALHDGQESAWRENAAALGIEDQHVSFTKLLLPPGAGFDLESLTWQPGWEAQSQAAQGPPAGNFSWEIVSTAGLVDAFMAQDSGGI